MHAPRTWPLLGLALVLSGCQPETPKAANPAKTINNTPAAQAPAPAANQPKPGDNKPILNVDAGQSAAMHVTRAKDIQALKADMNQIAQFYIQYETENNRAPGSWQEFKTYMGNDGARYAKHVETDKVAINFGVKPSSTTVIAYEKKPDLNGLQVAVFGDKSVRSLKPDELKQALQNK